MNIQLRSPPLEDAADILKGLQARGLTSIMSGLDNLRNMVGSPIAGTAFNDFCNALMHDPSPSSNAVLQLPLTLASRATVSFLTLNTAHDYFSI